MSDSQEHLTLPPSEARIVSRRRKNRIALEVAGAAIFGALSIAISFIATFIPRISGWYIAIFDPISLIWMLSFLIFGFRAGILTMVIGALGLMPFDPTVWLGPLMKFLSTVWLIVIPWAFTRLRTKNPVTGHELAKLHNYLPSMAIAWIVRCIVMVLTNILVLRLMMPFLIGGLSLDWLGISGVLGLQAVVVTVVIVNTVQSLFDAIVPYLVVFTGKIYERFEIY